MKNKIILFSIISFAFHSYAQELYPNSEPASIIPKHALGVRLMNEAYVSSNNFKSWHGAMIMFGVSPKWMLNAMVTASNHHYKMLPENYIQKDANEMQYIKQDLSQSYSYLFESVNFGFRYRFLNRDGDHKHLRMALYSNGVYSIRPHDEAEITLMGNNKAVGGGLITTILLNKLAISVSGGIIKPFSHKENSSRTIFNYGNAYNYNLSFGYLVFPVKYKNFKQTNLNLYAEFMGKSYSAIDITKAGQVVSTGNEKAYKDGNFLELRPALQFIIKSNLRIDCSTAIPIVNRSYIRNYPVYLLNIQYYFFL